MGLRERVKGTQGPYAVAGLACVGDVTRQGGRVAGDVGDSARLESSNVLDDRLAGPGARWVQNDQVGANPLSYQWFQDPVNLASANLDLGPVPQVALGIADCARVRLDGKNRPGGTHRVGQRQREKAHTRIEVHRSLAR